MDPQETCAERIGEHMNGRLDDLGALRDLVDVGDSTELATLLEDSATRDLFADLVETAPGAPGILAMLEGNDDEQEAFLAYLDAVDLDGLREAAQARMDELPLGVSSYTTFRVDLSTGGPADWLEIVCTGDTPTYEAGGEPYEIERIVYHFADWFDHADRQLGGVDFEIAERFARSVVPELVG